LGLLERKQLACTNLHYFYYPLEYAFRKLQEAGFASIDFYGGTPHFWMDSVSYSDCKQLKRLASDYGLDIIAFTPEVASFHHTLCTNDEAWQKRSIAFYKNAVRAAVELEVKIVVINAVGAFRDVPLEQTYLHVRDNLCELCEYAEKNNILLAMETVRSEEQGFISRLEMLKRLKADVNSNVLKAVLDTCAMGTAGETVDQWFKTFGEDLIHIHFTDGRPAGHRVWGEGCFPMDRFVKSIVKNRYKGFLELKLANDEYYDEPGAADKKNMKVLEQYFQ